MIVECNGCSDLDPPDTNHEPVKSLNHRTCLECDERDGVLVCNNADCRIAVHKDCMPCAAYFNNDSKFYCPYCVYKHSLDEYCKARDRNISAKTALISFLDTKAARRTGAACIFKSLKRGKLEGIDLTYQKDFVRDRSLPTVEVLRKSDEIGEAHIGQVGGGKRFSQSSLQDDSHMVKMDVLQVKLKSENLKIKRQKTAVDMEGNCKGSVQRKETQSGLCGTVEKDKGFDILGLNPGQAIETIKLEDDRGRGNFQSSGEMHRGQTIDSNISQECTSLEQLKVKSDCDEQPAETQNYESDDAKNMPQSPKSAACHTRKHDTSVIHKETVFYSRKHEGTKDTEEACYVDMEEKQQQLFKASIDLSRKEDMLVTSRTFIEGDDDAFRVTPNLEGIGDTHWKSADIQGKQQKHDVAPTSKENARVSYKELNTDDAPGLAPESHCMSQQTPVSVGRRKKLLWTIEEEETLKEGVEKFARTAKKNLPWTKILEFGSHVFDGTRTPVDLKDKWKRILSKVRDVNMLDDSPLF